MPEKAAKAAELEALPKKRKMVITSQGPILPKGVKKPNFSLCSENKELKVKTGIDKNKYVVSARKTDVKAHIDFI
jgi:hypothetical protein